MLYYLNTGGPVMWILFGISILSLAIILERLVYFTRREKPVSKTFKEEILASISQGDVRHAASICDCEINTVGRVLKEFMARCNQKGDAHHFEQLGKEIAIEGIEILERRLYILGIIGYVAPMLGLLGTVTGMIQSFKSVAAQGTGDPSVVASGISQALFTTAAGLTIAIPAIVMYNLFNKRIEKVESNTDRMLTSVTNLIRMHHVCKENQDGCTHIPEAPGVLAEHQESLARQSA